MRVSPEPLSAWSSNDFSHADETFVDHLFPSWSLYSLLPGRKAGRCWIKIMKFLPEKIRILVRIIFHTVLTSVDKKATLSLLVPRLSALNYRSGCFKWKPAYSTLIFTFNQFLLPSLFSLNSPRSWRSEWRKLRDCLW